MTRHTALVAADLLSLQRVGPRSGPFANCQRLMDYCIRVNQPSQVVALFNIYAGFYTGCQRRTYQQTTSLFFCMACSAARQLAVSTNVFLSLIFFATETMHARLHGCATSVGLTPCRPTGAQFRTFHSKRTAAATLTTYAVGTYNPSTSTSARQAFIFGLNGYTALAFANRLAAEGWQVCGTVRRPAKAAYLTQKVKSATVNAWQVDSVCCGRRSVLDWTGLRRCVAIDVVDQSAR